MIVFITEKNSAKRNFARAFGGDRGKYKGNDYIIEVLSGHLYQFSDPEKQVPKDKVEYYSKWKIDSLPWNEEDIRWKREMVPGSSAKLKSIKENLTKATEIIIATDIDSSGEGDLLGFEVIEELGFTKKKISRMYFTDEKPESLRKAFDERKEIKDIDNYYDYQKALFRSKWDFLSMQFTRVATIMAPGRMVLRQGRLKSFIVTLIGDLLKDIENYKAVPFYEERFIDENGIVYTNSKVEQKEKPELVDLDKYHESKVEIYKTDRKKQSPPLLIDLMGIISRLSGRYSPQEIKDTYQKMYQDEIVSYPRTDDKKITIAQFNDFLSISDKVADLVGVDKSLLVHKKPRPTHIHESGAHGANRPDYNVPNKLEDLNKYGRSAIAIYKIVAKSSLAMLCDDYIYDKSYGRVFDFKDFTASINSPVSMGWKSIYSSDDEDEENASSNKTFGEKAEPYVHEGFPPKPNDPSVSWLTKALKRYNVGTASTRASVLIELTNTKHKFPLLLNDRGKLNLTGYGKMSYELTRNTEIASRDLTENIIDVMNNIGKGQTNLIDSELSKLSKLVENDIKNIQKNVKSLPKYEKKEYPKKEKASGVFNGETIEFNRKWGSYEFTDEEIERLLNGEELVLENLKSTKKNTTYSVKGKLAKQKFKGRFFYGFKVIEFL